MSSPKKCKAILIGFALAASPLVTTATCSPQSGSFDFFRDDHDHDDHPLDFLVDDGCWFYEDCHHDHYYEEIIFFD